MAPLISRYFRWTFYSVLIGILAGLAAAVFLFSLNSATVFRDQHPEIIWLLPVAGLFIGWIYYRYGNNADAGTGLILEEIHNPKNVLPFRMAPFVLFGTILTHLFGGSAGREGTAVQMGSSLADQLSRFFKIEAEERKILLIAGAGAGFSAAIGAPLAGAVFGLEVIQVGRIRVFAWFESLVASFVAFYTCQLLGAPHSVFPKIAISFDLKSVALVALAGICFGLAARIFIAFTHLLEKIFKNYIKHPAFRPFLAGCLLVVFYFLEGSYKFVGLGIPIIQDAFTTPTSWIDPVFKGFFTSLTVGTGFKGGEFIPLVFIGTTLGSFLSTLLPVGLPLLCAVGFVSVFGAAANTPLACAIMACEIFGWTIAPYAWVGCYMAYLVSGQRGIYKNQLNDRRKL